jgi:tetratricopeptide (TPR) repeat protein
VGLGAAKSGDLKAAEEALARLRKLDEPVLEKQVAAAVLLRKKKPDEALKLLAEAADAESKMAPPMGPPEPMKPSHELYGEALLELGKAEEAAKQFDLALLRMPNRTGSLLGAARAAAKLGDDETARRHYAALAAIWSQADPGFAELAEVRAYLEKAPESRPAR